MTILPYGLDRRFSEAEDSLAKELRRTSGLPRGIQCAHAAQVHVESREAKTRFVVSVSMSCDP